MAHTGAMRTIFLADKGEMNRQAGGFREDINGLRAWAVVVVVLYHFGVAGFSGGFVGVDVFFVISGFLMTGIIVTGLEGSARNGNGFSVGRFYLARAIRIVPALALLCAGLLVAGWFFLVPREYALLGGDAASALGFFSNIKFLREMDYFAPASHDRLLLHTWSLSVEWQFYLLLPLVLWGIWKIRPGRQTLTTMMVLGLAVSLLLCVVFTPTRTSAAFFLLPTRAWEMLAGGLVWLLANPVVLSARGQRRLEATGFALIIASVALLEEGGEWPGWRALLPVLGTVLVLVAARRQSAWSGSRAAQWLGDSSYSLYLWHWPIAVALVHLQLQGQPGAMAAGIALTLVAGWLSWRFVEVPARARLNRLPAGHGAAVLLTAVTLVCVPALLVIWQQGVPARVPAQVNAVMAEADNVNPRGGECFVDKVGAGRVPECVYGGDRLGVIVLGDSHAAAIIRSVEKALPDAGLHVLDWTLASCPTILGIHDRLDPDDYCRKFLAQKMSDLRRLPRDVPLLIVNRYALYAHGVNEPALFSRGKLPRSYLGSADEPRGEVHRQSLRQGFIDTACELARTRTVYMLRAIPEMGRNVPTAMARSLLLPGDAWHPSVSLAEYGQRNDFAKDVQDAASARCGIRILDPLPYLCADGRCRGETGGLPIYRDDNHLNERGSGLLIPLFRQMFVPQS